MSKPVEVFQEAYAVDGVTLERTLLLVSIIDDMNEVKTKSNLVLVQSDNQLHGSIASNKPLFCEVLIAGCGYGTEDEQVTPISQPGSIIVVGQNSVSAFSHFGQLVLADKKEKIGLVNDSEVMMRFDSREAFDAFFERLNNGLS